MTPLRDYLISVYGGFADRRHSDPSLDHAIKIDDESKRDVSNLFCRIFVRIPERNGSSLILTMQNAPIDAAAEDLIEQQGGELTFTPYGPKVTLPLQVTSITFIRRLATTIRNTVGRGKRYLNCNWKWSCGRTADSLDRLADELKAYRIQRSSVRESPGQPIGTSDAPQSR